MTQPKSHFRAALDVYSKAIKRTQKLMLRAEREKLDRESARRSGIPQYKIRQWRSELD